MLWTRPTKPLLQFCVRKSLQMGEGREVSYWQICTKWHTPLGKYASAEIAPNPLCIVWKNQVVFLASPWTLSSLKSSALTEWDQSQNSYQAAHLHSRLCRRCIFGRFFLCLHILSVAAITGAVSLQETASFTTALNSLWIWLWKTKYKSRMHLAGYSYSTQAVQPVFSSVVLEKATKASQKWEKSLGMYFLPFGLVDPRYS